jgi:hypothetical protein
MTVSLKLVSLKLVLRSKTPNPKIQSLKKVLFYMYK